MISKPVVAIVVLLLSPLTPYGLYLLSGMSHGISPDHLQAPTVKLLNGVPVSASAVDSLNTNTLQLPQAPFKTFLGTSPGIEADYKNTSPSPLDVTAYASMHNADGQTVAIGVGSVHIGPNETTQFKLSTGLPAGNYTADVFAVTQSGVVVSKDTPMKVTFTQDEINFVGKAVASGYNSQIAAMLWNHPSGYVKTNYGVNDSANSIVLKLANANGSIYPAHNVASLLLNQVYGDSIVSQKVPVAAYGSNLLNQIGVTGFNQIGTISDVGNLSTGIVQNHLPQIPLPTVSAGLQADEKDSQLTNFTPESVKNFNGTLITVYKSQNISRDTWVRFWLGTQRDIFNPNTVKDQGEWKHAFVNGMDWSLFDNQFGPGYFDNPLSRMHYKPTDSQAQQVILANYDFIVNSLLPKVRSDTSGMFMPFAQHFTNKTALSQDMAKRSDRAMAYRGFFDQPASTIDPSTNQIVNGIKAMLLQPQTESQNLNTLVNLYKQAKIDESTVYSTFPNFDLSSWQAFYQNYKSLVKVVSGSPSAEYYWTRLYFWQWLVDRYNHGISNTVEQFLPINKALTQSLSGYDFARLAMGYGRNSSATTPPQDWEGSTYTIPLLLKSIGIPSLVGGDFSHYINSTTPGATAYGFELGILGIPDKTISTLKSGAYGQVVIGPGNEFGLLSCVGGLQADLAAGAQHVNVEPYLASANVYEVLGYNPTVWPFQFTGTKIYLESPTG